MWGCMGSHQDRGGGPRSTEVGPLRLTWALLLLLLSFRSPPADRDTNVDVWVSGCAL